LLSLLSFFVAVKPAEAAPITANLPTMRITLTDPIASHNTLSYIHSNKDNVVQSMVGIEDGSGTYNLVASAAEMKGRGNYTWNLPKKPYQIKFANSTSILGMPKGKAWVLLANDADGSLMRNKLAFDYALAIGSPFASESRWVDLVVNGEYLGNYLVAEKVEVKTNRVDLTDPKAVLSELDNNYGYAEDYKFISTTSKTTFTLKDAKSGVPDLPTPLPADSAAGWADMQATLNKLDGLLAAASPDWAAISAIIDIDSFAKFYFVNELTENPEIVASSIYFYKNGLTSKLYAGPVWDYDSSLGTYDHTESLGAFTNAEYTKNADWLRYRGNGWYRQLFRNPQFVAAVNAMWQTGGAGYAAAQLTSKIAQYKATIAASAANNFVRWKVLGTPTHLVAGEGRAYSSTYDGEVGYLSAWVGQRVAFLLRAYGDIPLLRYSGHVQSLGWRPAVNNGQIGGTVNQNLQLEALSWTLTNGAVPGGIEINAHVAGIGWMGYKGSPVGTTGQGRAMEAFQVRLTGELATKYDVSYRAHVRNVGWQGWVTNGATAGTTGQAKQMEAVMIRLLAKNPAAPTNPAPVTTTTAPVTTTTAPVITTTAPVTTTTAPVTTTTAPVITTTAPVTTTTTTTTTPPPAVSAVPSYSAHVATIGWMATVTNDAIAGTTGRALAMEALRLQILKTGITGDISYRGHVSGIGWQPYVTSSTYIGTTGQSRRLEAMQITLTGELATKYRIEYRAHVSGIGWQPYVADGAVAGTTGQSRAIEAVQIRLVPKV